LHLIKRDIWTEQTNELFLPLQVSVYLIENKAHEPNSYDTRQMIRFLRWGSPSTAATSSEPRPDEIRAAVERVSASDAFRSSPQLVAFLRYVVECVLSGDTSRVKAYTIAVEALGRSPSFDPQSDPIVRVVAGRLRRTLDLYYAGQGTDDPVAINLPRGKYIPGFVRRRPAIRWPRGLETLRRPLFTIHWQPNSLELAGAAVIVVVLCGGLIKLGCGSCGLWFN